jgi:DNA-binding GntR family transcriptional regulator
MDTLVFVEKITVTSHAIAAQLREQIAGGSRKPGEPLRQEMIAADLGVSRMPVRDALNQLHAEGLVDLMPNRGAFVASMSAKECVEIFDLRVLLECDALTHAVPCHTEKSLRRLQQIQRDLELEDDTCLWADGDRHFHSALYEPCERKRTLQIIDSLRNAVERFYLANLQHDDHRRGWKKEHRDILKATMDGNAKLACEKLRAHLRATQKVVLKAIQKSGDE